MDDDTTYDMVVLDLVDLAPCTHHPAVVGGDDGHDVHVLALELVVLLDVGREVVCLAAGGESACKIVE